MRDVEQLRSRFLDKITTPISADTCIEWHGHIDTDGYGSMFTHRDTFRAHRVSYELFVGPIPPGLTIDHLCRNTRCVNVFHLEAVPAGVNVLRGDGPTARNARKTHCLNGHPFSGDNLGIDHDGNRECRACKKQRAHDLYRKNKACVA